MKGLRYVRYYDRRNYDFSADAAIQLIVGSDPRSLAVGESKCNAKASCNAKNSQTQAYYTIYTTTTIACNK